MKLDFYSFEHLNHSNSTFGISHANFIDFGSQYNVKWNVSVNRIPQKQCANEMKQEEQEDEYINAFDFLNNF